MEPEVLRRAFLYSLVLEDCVVHNRECELQLFFQLPTSTCSDELIDSAQSHCLSHQTLYVLLKSYYQQHRGCNWALMRCAELGFFDLVLRALEEGADIHYCQNYALCQAVSNGHYTIVSLLLERGADLHVCNDEPLFLAICAGHTEIVQLLLAHGACDVIS